MRYAVKFRCAHNFFDLTSRMIVFMKVLKRKSIKHITRFRFSVTVGFGFQLALGFGLGLPSEPVRRVRQAKHG